MKLSTVTEALNSEVDEPVLAIRGTLTKLFTPMTGEGQYGAWSLQNGAIKDKTGEIKILFSNRDEVPQNWRGKVIELRCTKGQKGGWSGVKRVVDKKDKKTPKLDISDKAEVLLFDAEHQPEEPPAKPNATAKTPSSPPQTPSDTPRGMAPQEPPEAPQAVPRAPDEAGKLAEGMAAIYQILNAQLAVITLVHNYLVPAVKHRTGLTIDAQQEASLVQNCLIQMYYQKSHWNFRQRPYPMGDKQNGGPPPPPE